MLVTVKKATNLPAADGNGLSDPYVRMMLDEKKKKTHTQKKTLSPTWNEKHEWLHVRLLHSAGAPSSFACLTNMQCAQSDPSSLVCSFDRPGGPWSEERGMMRMHTMHQ